jgi:hypothetical protein
MLGIRGDQHGGGTGRRQDQPPGQRGRPERQGRRYTAGSDYCERRNRHPAVSDPRLGEGADGASEPVEGRGLQCGGDRAPADQGDEGDSSRD